mgnify:CR=1 FL=1
MASLRPIVLVEDNPDDEMLTMRALQRSKLKNPILIARDGAEALDTIFAADPLPSVVLLDLKLPKVNGLEVLRHLRADARTRLLPVVMLTSSTEEQDIVDSYDLGANSYVRKPVEFSQFTEAVTQLGLYWVLDSEQLPEEV